MRTFHIITQLIVSIQLSSCTHVYTYVHYVHCVQIKSGPKINCYNL